MERLAIMTCQRISDLVRMGPEGIEKEPTPWCTEIFAIFVVMKNLSGTAVTPA
jgi:hypothetical protein